MSKNKKRKDGQKNLSPQALEKKILNVLQNDLKGRYNAKDLKKKLNVDNNSDSIEAILEKMFLTSIVVKVANGQKYKINRNVETVETGEVKETVKTPENKKEKSREDSNNRNGYATGRVDMTRSGAAYIVSDDSGLDKDIFVPQGRVTNALKGDRVKVRWFISRRGKPEGEIIEVLERHRESFIGTMVLSNKFCFVSPDDELVPVDIIVNRKNTKNAQNGDKVVVKIIEWHPKHGVGNPLGEVSLVLGQAGSSDIEMKSILIKNGFELDFNEAVMRENDAIPTVILPSEINIRRDFRPITTFTIDPETAKDFDDAISIQLLENGNYEIGVHIADVTHYVRENSALDKEAAKRTTSVYLVDRVLPMLPEKLSNGVCSLRPHEDKLTFSAVFEFTAKGEIKNSWFGKTVIHSDRRFTYEEVQEILEGKEGDFVNELKILNNFAHLLRNDRFKKGAISFESPEIKFKLDENGKPLEAYVKERKDAHMLVEDFMLLANRMVAQQIMDFFRSGHPKIPFVYRIHDLPDMEKVNNFANFAARLGYPMKIKSADSVYSAFNKLLKDAQGKNELGVLQQLAIRTMAKAAYSVDNIGHYGLAFVDYTHFTSPIRRYADVLVHRIFEQFLNNSVIKYNATKLEEICKHISRKERNAMEAERESVKYKQAEYLLDKVGAVFEAFISGMTEFGVYAEIKQNYCEGMIRYENMYDNFVLLEDGFHIRSTDRVYKMGDAIWVQIKRVDLSKRQIDLQLLREEDAVTALAVQNLPKTEEELKPVIPELIDKNVSELEKLFVEIAVAYDLSEASKRAKELNKDWSYAISETALHKSSIVLLDFNPLARKNQKYIAQTTLADNIFNREQNPKITNLIETYFSGSHLDEMVQSYFCPFRSDAEVSENDANASIDIFKKWIKILEPKQIVSISPTLLNFLIKNKLLSEIQNLEIQSGKKNITLTKGILKSGKLKVQIAFLSDLNANISKENKNKVLSWLNPG